MTTVDIKKADREGWLEKESRVLKRWKRRWFVLEGCMLYSFKHQKEYLNPTEIIDLREYSSVKSSDRTTGNNSFDLYSRNHVFSLIANSESEKEDWIRALGRAIVYARNDAHEDESEEEEEDSDCDY